MELLIKGDCLVELDDNYFDIASEGINAINRSSVI